MKRNVRRSKKMSVVASHTVYAAAILLMLFVTVFLNMGASSRCDQLNRQIAQKQATLDALEQDRVRASDRWEQMKTAENLERVLVRRGINMKYPGADQWVKMSSSTGRPYPGQLSLARLNGSPSAAVAQVAPRKSSGRRRR